MTDWVLNLIREYYKTQLIDVPKMEQREWGMGYLSKAPVNRHLSFKSPEELRTYLVRRPPLHLYHSITYWKFPEAPIMRDKEWLGADILFEIDAPDVLGKKVAEHKTLDEIISLVLPSVTRLTELIQEEFGVAERDIKGWYSGHRGFHIVIRDKELIEIKEGGRRTLASYLRLDTINSARECKKLLRRTPLTAGTKRMLSPLKEIIISPETWQITPQLKKVLQANKSKLLNTLNKGFIPIGLLRSKEIEEIITLAQKQAAISIDYKVAVDIHRLSRTPNSIHGETGLVAVKIPFNKLQDFKLKQAWMPGIEKKEPQAITALENATINIGGETYKLQKGEKQLLPLPEALYAILCGAGQAT